MFQHLLPQASSKFCSNSAEFSSSPMADHIHFDDLHDAQKQFINTLKAESLHRAALEQRLWEQIAGIEQKFSNSLAVIQSQLLRMSGVGVREQSILGPTPGLLRSSSNLVDTPLPRVDFPSFDGTNPRAWMLKCNSYFKIMPSISDVEKVNMAIMHFEGKASSWYHNLNVGDLILTWKQFLELVSSRFEYRRPFAEVGTDFDVNLSEEEGDLVEEEMDSTHVEENPLVYDFIPMKRDSVPPSHMGVQDNYGEDGQNGIPGENGAVSAATTHYSASQMKVSDGVQYDGLTDNMKILDSEYEDGFENIGLSLDPSLVDFDINSLRIINNADFVEQTEMACADEEDKHHEVFKERRKRKAFENFVGGLDNVLTSWDPGDSIDVANLRLSGRLWDYQKQSSVDIRARDTWIELEEGSTIGRLSAGANFGRASIAENKLEKLQDEEQIEELFLRVLTFLLSTFFQVNVWGHEKVVSLFNSLLQKLYIGDTINSNCLQILPSVVNILVGPLVTGYEDSTKDPNEFHSVAVDWLKNPVLFPPLNTWHTGEDMEDWLQLVISCFPVKVTNLIGGVKPVRCALHMERTILYELLLKQRHSASVVVNKLPCEQYRKHTIVGVLQAERDLVPLFPIHGLDRLVSGLIIIARSAAKADTFKLLIESDEVKTRYIARVTEVILEDEQVAGVHVYYNAREGRSTTEEENGLSGKNSGIGKAACIKFTGIRTNSDFGPAFTIFDVDGEEPHTGIITSISNDNPALVARVDDDMLEFQDGDLVVFSAVRGMTKLNDGKLRKVQNARLYSFFLEEDIINNGAYGRGSILTQVKQPKVLNFKLLKEALKDTGEFLLGWLISSSVPATSSDSNLNHDKFVFLILKDDDRLQRGVLSGLKCEMGHSLKCARKFGLFKKTKSGCGCMVQEDHETVYEQGETNLGNNKSRSGRDHSFGSTVHISLYPIIVMEIEENESGRVVKADEGDSNASSYERCRNSYTTGGVLKKGLPMEFNLRKKHTTDGLNCMCCTFSSLDPRGRGSSSGGGIVMTHFDVNYGGDGVKKKRSTLVGAGVEIGEGKEEKRLRLKEVLGLSNELLGSKS